MEPDPSSSTDSRRSSQSHTALIVRLKLPPRALAMASSIDSHLPLPNPEKGQQNISSPFPPSSPPTIASSPAPGAVAPQKKRGGPGKRSRPGLAPGSGVFSVTNENGGGSGAGTPAPITEKERGKPGPKANPGGINAGLRALDRSGKPTRRWHRVQFPVKTCSGYTFYTTTWISPGNTTMFRVKADGPVPGDGLYEERMKTEGIENQWNGVEGQENEKPYEQDVVMGDANAVVA